MSEGTLLRDAGANSVLMRSRKWKENGLSLLMTLVAAGQEVTAEDVRSWLGDPPVPNAMGALFLAACKIGIIERVGYRRSGRTKRHAGLMGIYRRAGEEAA